MKKGPEEKLADYERVVDLINRSPNDELDNESLRLIDELVNEIEIPDDPIYQVNCLQLIADLGASPQALALLESKHVPAKLIAFLNDNDVLIVPHALKLFYRIKPADLQAKYPQVLDKICDYCQSDNKQLYDYAVDFLTALGRHGYAGRKVLHNTESFTDKCLPCLGRAIINSDSLIKNRTLQCTLDLLKVLEDEPNIQEARKLSELMYHAIIPGEYKMTNQLIMLCRVPFLEIRSIAMLVVANVVAPIEWGQIELKAVQHTDFVKWLLDRSTESSKDTKEAKFEILKAIVKSKTAVHVFTGEIYMKMRADFKNGPFHVGIAEEMLMENQSAN